MSEVAYVDESIRGDREPTAYVLVASVMQLAVRNEVRESLRPLHRLGAGPAFHWKDAKPHRYAAVTILAELDSQVRHIAVVGQPLDEHRLERGRRHCLQRLLFELEHVGVEQVWMESRRIREDQRDNEAVGAFRAQHVITAGLRVDHLPGKTPDSERLLCIPDVVAGALRAHLAGDPEHLAVVARLIERHDIGLA